MVYFSKLIIVVYVRWCGVEASGGVGVVVVVVVSLVCGACDGVCGEGGVREAWCCTLTSHGSLLIDTQTPYAICSLVLLSTPPPPS